MGKSQPRDAEGAAMRANVRLALQTGINSLDRLVHHGPKAYAEHLRHVAEEPGRDDLAKAIILAVADNVYVEPEPPEEVYLECRHCDKRIEGLPGEDLDALMERVAYCDGEAPTGPKPWWSIDSDAGGIAYCPDHNHVNEEE